MDLGINLVVTKA